MYRSPMRKVITVTFASLLLFSLVACGGSTKKAASSDSSKSTKSSGSSSSSSGGGGGGDSDICKALGNVDTSNIEGDPNSAKAALEAFGKVDPPSEIAGEWNDYLQALKEISEADQNDQAALAQIGIKHLNSLVKVSQFFLGKCLNSAFSDLSDLSSLSELSSLSDLTNLSPSNN
jgi:hypothetical protein